MPLFFIFFGTLLLVATIRGQDQTTKLFALLKSDFSGPNNYFVWALAIGSISALGYAKPLRTFSNLFLGLVFLVIVLAKKGPNGQDLISSFFSQIESTET